ncbi:g4289 [Coccomyxa viridis]|uniref:G4289 protein n=1 Tax=Coccomyxa viridis TaxID=1274662 RepID=A0ABP1FQ10_9CHLO
MLVYGAYVVALTLGLRICIPDLKEHEEFAAIQDVITTIGFALFLLLTFRTQTAYDRWWEGRVVFGELMSASADFCRLAEAWVDDQLLATRLMTWVTVYSVAVKQKLHYSRDMSEVTNILSLGDMKAMAAYEDMPLYCISQASRTLREIYAGQSAQSPPIYILTEMDKRLRSATYQLDNLLRIRNTPMPAFIGVWLMILPLAFVVRLSWYTIPLSLLVGYELLGFEEMGVEIENPFSGSYSGLPLEDLTGTIAVTTQHFLRRMKERAGIYQVAPDGKDHSRHMKRSKSAVEADHVVDTQAALSEITAHHHELDKARLYDRLGGHAAVEAAVDIFYKKLLADEQVSHFFNGISIARLKEKQVKFLTYALGGADEYHGTDPTVSHRRLHNEKGLRVEHFHIVLGHLQDTLRELGVAEDLIDEVTATVAPMEKTFGCGDEKLPCDGH